jgi:hypothetical protein
MVIIQDQAPIFIKTPKIVFEFKARDLHSRSIKRFLSPLEGPNHIMKQTVLKLFFLFLLAGDFLTRPI